MNAPVQASGDAALQAVWTRFLDRFLELNPTDATQLGDHRFDGRWPDLGPAGEKQQRAFIAETRAALETIDAKGLSESGQIDRAVIEARLARWTFELDRLRTWTKDPLFYTGLVGDGLDPLVTREFAPEVERMESLRQRLEALPAVLALARASLQHPAKVMTETAMRQNDGLIGLVEGLEKDGKQGDAARHAAAALQEFGAFLKDDLLPRSDGDFRRGAEIFREKLRYNLGSDTPPEELYAAARATMQRTQEEMAQTALELWPELFPGKPAPRPQTRAEKMRLVRQVLDQIAEDRPTDKTIVDDTRRAIAQATDFVRAHDLVRVPDEPLRVIEVPEYKRGVAGGYCESSGPLEKKKETVVAISPTPADWTPARVESFYKEYNRAMVAEFAVHEAMPGHYLQIAHANARPDPILAVFDNGAYVEGWAVYGEWLMARTGFGGPRVRLTRQKMMLRTAANTILDHDIHAGQMSREEALKLMMEEALQEEGEAVGKWQRAQLSCGQLSTYFYGFHELMKVRERAEQQPGFNERAFNDKLLSFGAPPPKYLAHLMLGDPMP